MDLETCNELVEELRIANARASNWVVEHNLGKIWTVFGDDLPSLLKTHKIPFVMGGTVRIYSVAEVQHFIDQWMHSMLGLGTDG